MASTPVSRLEPEVCQFQKLQGVPIMVRVMSRKIVMVSLVAVLSAVMAGCSSTGNELSESRVAERLQAQREQERLDRQRLAGLEGGLARSLHTDGLDLA